MNPISVVIALKKQSLRAVRFAPLIGLAMLAASCASTPAGSGRPVLSTALDCHQLRVAIADAEDARLDANEKQQSAWKAVIPFAVAARYASGKSALAEADVRLTELNSRFVRQGCAS
jgi:hypothetical protein